MKRLFSIVALPLLAVLFTGFSTVVPVSASSVPARTAMQKAGIATPSDAQIDATIRTKLAKSKIGKDGFKFHVQRGVVTWQGATNVMQHKGSATRMARAAGAAQVVNNIQISGAGQAKAFGAMRKAYVK